MENWVNIEDFKNYEVSNLGNVRSLNYRNTANTALLSPGVDSDGYLIVVLRKDNKSFTKKVHRLVSSAFIGDLVDDMTVNHKDGDKQNNRVENLEIVTLKANIQHAFSVLKRESSKSMKGRFGSQHNKSKAVLQFKENVQIAEFGSIMEAFRLTGINFRNISETCNGKKKSAGGCFWKFK